MFRGSGSEPAGRAESIIISKLVLCRSGPAGAGPVARRTCSAFAATRPQTRRRSPAPVARTGSSGGSRADPGPESKRAVRGAGR